MSAWLDALLGRIRNGGVDLTLGVGLNFTNGIQAQKNSTTGFTDVSLQSDVIVPSQLAPASVADFAVPIVRRVAFVVGGASAADDVEILALAPFDLRIVDAAFLVSTNLAGSTWQLRTSTGGGGSALSSAVSAATATAQRNADTETRTVTQGSPIYLRRSSDQTAGEVVIWAVRT